MCLCAWSIIIHTQAWIRNNIHKAFLGYDLYDYFSDHKIDGSSQFRGSTASNMEYFKYFPYEIL